MEDYEEIIHLIIRWLDAVLNIKIESLDDLIDGKFFLDVINKCSKIVIPVDQCEKYDLLEQTLDSVFKMQTDVVVDYEAMA